MPRPEHVRLVAVVGPPGAGTTTLVQALLGRPLTDLLVDDRPPGRARRPRRDPPDAARPARRPRARGGPDRGAARRRRRAARACPQPAGWTPPTAQLWARCEADGVPRAVAVTGVDRERADYDEAVALCQRLLDDEVLPVQVPMHDDDGTVAGVLQLLAQTVVDHSAGQRVERPADPEHVTLVQEHRADLVEAVLAEAEDGSLLDRYLEGDEPSTDDLVDGLHRGVASGHLHPALGVAPLRGVGVHELRRPAGARVPAAGPAPAGDASRRLPRGAAGGAPGRTARRRGAVAAAGCSSGPERSAPASRSW